MPQVRSDAYLVSVVHELSIACSLVDSASAAARRAGARRVTAVHVDVGRLAGVVTDALRFGYDVATRDTPLAGSQLVIRELPVVIFCSSCNREYELPGVHSFRCPVCGRPSPHVRQGKELDLVSLDVEMEG
jgi:hydrogenase nickel incorporation protein HypA/HybF